MNKKYLIIIGVLIIIASILFINRTKKVDWSPTFNEEDVNPLDTKVFFEQLPNWFVDQKITTLYTTYYEYANEFLNDNESPKNYIAITGNYTIDQPSFEALLTFVGNGNHALIAAHTFPAFMKDTLKFEVTYEKVNLLAPKKTAYLHHLKDSLSYGPKLPYGTARIKNDLHIKSLGYMHSESHEMQSNFVGIPYKKGVFYLHTTPELFTNYHLLNTKKNNHYLDQVISFLPEFPVLFEKNVKIDPDLNKGPLSFVLSKQPLRWAYYLALIMGVLFIIFNAKRRQRIIPIINPLENTTTAFVETISTLHLESKDYHGIIKKNIIYFLAHIRAKYYLPTHLLDADFIKNLAKKSGKPHEEVARLITLIIKLNNSNSGTTEVLKKLNKELENFYKKS